LADDERIVGQIDESNQYVVKLPEIIREDFAAIFAELDANPDRYNISNYNIRVTSLEEVFNKIGEEEHAAENAGVDSDATEAVVRHDINHEMTAWDHFKILRANRIMIGKRQKELFSALVFITIIAIMALLVALKINYAPNFVSTAVDSAYNGTDSLDYYNIAVPDVEFEGLVIKDFMELPAFSNQSRITVVKVPQPEILADGKELASNFSKTCATEKANFRLIDSTTEAPMHNEVMQGIYFGPSTKD
jgi:hypothetical protein